MRLTLSRWIPTQTTETIEREGGVVYLYAGRGLAAIGYKGKANKSTFHYTFRTEEKRRQFVEEFFAGIESAKAAAEERKQQRKAPHSLQIGDIVYNSWGYDQTNIDWYAVVATSVNFVTLRPIAGSVVGTGFMCGNSTPEKPIRYTSEKTTRHAVRAYEDYEYINFEHGSGSKWDGREKYCSWYA